MSQEIINTYIGFAAGCILKISNNEMQGKLERWCENSKQKYDWKSFPISDSLMITARCNR